MKKMNNSKKKLKVFSLILCIIVIIILSFFTIKNILYPKIFTSGIKSVNNTVNKKKFDTDVVGWLKVQGTNINYPVIYNSDDYSVDSFNLDDFLWTNKNSKKLENRMFVIGHNILNSSSQPLITDKNHTRFEQLLSFVYYDFAKDNEYVQFTIDGRDYVYKIFSISFVHDSDVDYYSNSFSKDELNKYINKSLKDSFYKYDVSVSKDDKVITLLTCTRMFGEYSDYMFKIDARLVHKNEFRNKYKITKKSNYKKISKILEGDVENENNKA